jgi:hypothetical protein
MKHPLSRGERRHVRDYYIERRRFTYEHVWRMDNEPLSEMNHIPPFTEWGKYSKWNLNCNCSLCHYEKHSGRRQRRERLKSDIKENIRSFE